MSKTRATEEELIDIASRMSQELQEFIDEAEKAGCENPLPGTQALLNEWQEIYQRTSLCWQSDLAESDSPIAALDKYRPSNGSEGELFIGQWCGSCERDKAANGTKRFDECFDGDLCQIVAMTYVLDIDDPEYPKEWVYGKDGPYCTAHKPINCKD